MNKYSGSNFDDFLREEGALKEVSERARKRLLTLQINEITAESRDEDDTRLEVEKPNPRNNELVIAILESTTYLVCTPNRGVVRGMPILVGQDKVERATDFQVN